MTHPLSTRLHQFILAHYNLEEFRTLCFRLNIEYDDLGGEGRSDKARELIRHAERRRQLPQLSNLLRQTRPDHFDQAGLSSAAAALNALQPPAPPVPFMAARGSAATWPRRCAPSATYTPWWAWAAWARPPWPPR